MDVKKVKVFSQTGVLPQYKTREAACCDLEASFGGRLEVGCIAMIPTGLFTEIPVGYKINILPRSGLSKKGITIPNAPGTIDSDYRGEIKVLLINLSEEDFHYQNSSDGNCSCYSNILESS